MSEKKWTITQLVSYVKSRLSNDFVLKNIQVSGEIGNFTNHFSGHWYFTLKDATSLINCCMFKTNNRTAKFLPKNGDCVDVIGSINVFERNGQLQLICSSMELSGGGDFYAQFEKTKNKLAPLGYFDETHKKPIPKFNNEIAVITGANTAALQDIRITVSKRWPMAHLQEVNALVQGSEAVSSIVNAIRKADSLNCDVIILARGGGSVDDLWCFNDESIAKAIFECKTPLVSGIGHEIDTTIADLVADKRCATPTAAAQAVTADYREVLLAIEQNVRLMKSAVERRLNTCCQLLDYQSTQLLRYSEHLKSLQTDLSAKKQLQCNGIQALLMNYHNRNERNKLILQNYGLNQGEKIHSELEKKVKRIDDLLQFRLLSQKQQTDALNRTFASASQFLYERKHNELTARMQLLDSYSPLATLKRGYSITTHNHRVVKELNQIQLNDEIEVRLNDGTLKATVNGKE